MFNAHTHTHTHINLQLKMDTHLNMQIYKCIDTHMLSESVLRLGVCEVSC